MGDNIYILREIGMVWEWEGFRGVYIYIKTVIDGNTEEAYVVCWLFGKSARQLSFSVYSV